MVFVIIGNELEYDQTFQTSSIPSAPIIVFTTIAEASSANGIPITINSFVNPDGRDFEF